MDITRSHLHDLNRPDAFTWLAGIEDTFITAPSVRTGRTLDEYELTEHYTRWRQDIDLFAELGLRSVRYGIPWHRINPAPNVWNFDWADAPLERLLELRIQPVVDLVHYGTPAWLEGAFSHPDFPSYMAEYAARVAERYRGRIHAYTPLNEPRVTAWYCGKLGWWPPNRRGWRGFATLMMQICRGIVNTVRAMQEVDPEIVQVHVDATDLFTTRDAELAPEAAFRQELVFLALDLVSGKVDPLHPLFDWLIRSGVQMTELDWMRENAVALDVIGINLYPLFSEKVLARPGGHLRVRMPYASADIIDRLSLLYWNRYRRPLLISETASEGSVAKRQRWLESSVAAVARVRRHGVPLIGYTWWPLFSLVTWGYREGRKAPADYLKRMGLWDLEPGPGGLERRPTPLVPQYRGLVTGGSRAVGQVLETAPSVVSERIAHVP